MAFTNQPYAGDQNGEENFSYSKVIIIRSIKVDSTTEYVAAGGDTFATAAELNQFKANRAYLKSMVRDQFLHPRSKQPHLDFLQISGSGQTGNGSGDVKPIPDPRISQSYFGSTNGIGASGGAAIGHDSCKLLSLTHLRH